jgi:hypothetical protein
VGYRDGREALIAERDGLRRELEENAAELEALRAAAAEKAALDRKDADQHPASPRAAGVTVPHVKAEPPDGPKPAVAMKIGVAVVVGLAAGLVYVLLTTEATAPAPEVASTVDDVRTVIPLHQCVPADSDLTFHVRTVISDAGVVTSASVVSTDLGAIVEDTPTTACIEAAVLGHEVPLLRDVTVILPINPSMPQDMVWASAVAHASRP